MQVQKLVENLTLVRETSLTEFTWNVKGYNLAFEPPTPFCSQPFRITGTEIKVFFKLSPGNKIELFLWQENLLDSMFSLNVVLETHHGYFNFTQERNNGNGMYRNFVEFSHDDCDVETLSGKFEITCTWLRNEVDRTNEVAIDEKIACEEPDECSETMFAECQSGRSSLELPCAGHALSDTQLGNFSFDSENSEFFVEGTSTERDQSEIFDSSFENEKDAAEAHNDAGPETDQSSRGSIGSEMKLMVLVTKNKIDSTQSAEINEAAMKALSVVVSVDNFYQLMFYAKQYSMQPTIDYIVKSFILKQNFGNLKACGQWQMLKADFALYVQVVETILEQSLKISIVI